MTLIEFTADTPKRKVGDRMRVDDASARSFCDVKNVAKRIDEEAEAAAAAEADAVVVATDSPTPTPPSPSRKSSSTPAPSGGGE